MAVPKHRTSKQKKRQRRSHLSLKKLDLMTCQQCGIQKKTHIVCQSCGFYKDKIVIKKMKDKSKK